MERDVFKSASATNGTVAGLAFMVLLVGAMSLSCSGFRRSSIEKDHFLGVAVEGDHAEEVKPLIRSAMERPVMTPQIEPRFTIQWVEDDSISVVFRYQNVLLVGALDSDDPVSQRVTTMLKGEVLEGVKEGRYRVFRKRDVWVRKQTVVVVVAETGDNLANWLADNRDELFRLFKEDRDERMKRNLYAVHEPKEMSDSLRQAHGWYLRLALDYIPVRSSDSPSYVRFRKLYPDRFLTVAWRRGSADEVNLETLTAWRDLIGFTFANPIRINPTGIRSREVTIAGRRALEVYGLWETLGPLGGGPFVAYLLHNNGDLYLLDGQVFAPDRGKEVFLRQMEIILKTFEPSP